MRQLSSLARHVQYGSPHITHPLWPVLLLLIVFVIAVPLAFMWSRGNHQHRI
jgi:hypothetical protein